jgi:CheY-like chemotaxis protein
VVSIAAVEGLDFPTPGVGLPTLLVVDDEPEICESLRRILRPHFKVTAVTDPGTALALIRGGRFDIVMTDMRMPKVSGVEVMRAARQHAPRTRLVLMSGHARSEIEQLRTEGEFLFIEKPFGSVAELLRALLALLPAPKPSAQ